VNAIEGTAAFDFHPRTRIVFGAGCAGRAGELAREWSARRVLLVTDAGIVRAGHVERVRAALVSAGLHVTVFDGVVENPTTREVEACCALARSAGVDTLIGLGGGSSLDTAKGCNFILTNGGVMQDYWGVGRAARPMLPMIAIPTTAGTGSECQSFALITDPATHQKMACGDPKAAARVALLDPTLTLTQPRHVAACTGIDTVAHAVESAVTAQRTPISRLFSREAFLLAHDHLPRVLDRGDDLASRGRMQLAAAFGGLAIENSMLGAAHSAANPLTAHFGVVHGQAVGLMLPWVVRFNGEDAETGREYASLALLAGLARADASTGQAVEALARRIEALLDHAGLARTLAALGIPRDALPRLADEAAAQWTARFNPRPVAAADFLALYERAFTQRPVG
jgi:alcohol dehydrogenase